MPLPLSSTSSRRLQAGHTGNGYRRCVEVHRLRATEGARLRDLRLEALRESPSAFATSLERARTRPPEYWDQAATESEAGDSRVTLIAVEDQAWVGMAAGFLHDDEPDTAGLGALWVSPGFRGAGVGRRLVEAVADWARDRGVALLETSVAAGNKTAVDLFRRAGFLPTGKERPLASNSSLTEVFLGREL